MMLFGLLSDTTAKYVAFLVIGAAFYFIRHSRSDAHLPPCPKRRWIIGNLLDIPRTIDWDVLARWGQDYHDVLFLKAFGYSILVLNSPEAVNDLLDKRGHIYSHRPRFVMAGELMGLNKCMALINYGSKYKQLRKLTQSALSADAIRKYHPVQEQIAIAYMHDLLTQPKKFEEQLRLAIGRVVLAITYGLSPQTADSEYIADAEYTLEIIGKAVLPGAYFVDLIPALQYLPRWLPGMSFLDHGKAGYKQIYNFVTRPFEHVKRDMAAGIAPPSFVSELLSDKDIMSMDANFDIEDGIKWVAGTMYGGGVETTYATVLTFILLMALHPEKQAKAQAEIDRVIGGEIVRIQDRDRLPYVRAVIQEVMRWHVVAPLSIARQTTESDTYKGYHIPAGTVVVPNVFALSQMDDAPRTFNPERFLDENNKPVNPTEYVFGFGRRLCPGKYLAENSIFVIIANILALFNLSAPPKTDSPAEDEAGLKHPSEVAFGPYLVSYPDKFRCNIFPRSKACADLVEQAHAAVEK